MTSSTSDTLTTPVLTGPENFQLWKLRREKVLHVVTGADPDPTIATTAPATAPNVSTTSASSAPLPSITSSSATDSWAARDEKAHSIIQDHISDALLMKTEACTTAKALFDELATIHNTSSVANAFYTFEQLIALKWDGTVQISDHIAKF
ncbi:hypothetical protein DFJ58DRAFT_657286 [Suillus subalutaceus]|uniref:uncharacterized protein n=1 Tax=Suillus subalutaceus TaxID=48586 RepID=UPI001B86E57E|nr:uncharacterized protein DFJ58DRAFT_657286 [Suillus subalutaceus]KAG1861733.1 hypothetical protein DFJ58DRAFT_657286 [Suillus subalutaceus]